MGQNRVSLALVAPSDAPPGWRLLRAASVRLPEGTLHEGALADVHALTLALRRLRREARVPRMQAAVTMSVNPLVVRLLDMPAAMPANVGDFVNSELTQCVALLGRNTTSDFCAVSGPGSVSRRLLAAAADTQTLRNLVRACDAAGVTAAVVEPALLACARAALPDKPEGPRASKRIIVEVSACHLSACVLHKGVLEAVRVKDVPSGAGGPHAVNQWVLEQMRTMIRCYGAHPRDASCEVRVVVRDGAYLADDTIAALRTTADVRTLTVEAPLPPGHQPEASRQDSPSPAVSQVALGLAVKMLDADSDPWRVNLLPEEVQQTRSFARHMLVAANVVALTVLGTMVALQLMTYATDKMRREIEKTKASQKLYATAALATKADALERRLGRARNQVRRMQDALREKRNVDWPSLLRKVREAAPTAVCITQLSSTDAENLVVRGLAPSYEEVRVFAQGLYGCGLFESASLAHVQKPKDDRDAIRYQIDCLVKTTP